MAGQTSSFSAAPSAAGYLYQARLALALCLRYVNADVGVEVGIERLDDVSFEQAGSALELLQAKHHIDRVASLTDNERRSMENLAGLERGDHRGSYLACSHPAEPW